MMFIASLIESRIAKTADATNTQGPLREFRPDQFACYLPDEGNRKPSCEAR